MKSHEGPSRRRRPPPKARSPHASARVAPRIPPTFASFGDLLARSGIEPSQRQLEQLWRFHRMLRERNAADDLTRLVGFESIVVKHYVDCWVVGDLLPLPSPLLDLGTGAGFPGIPLKIRDPALELVLVDARDKRVKFLEDVIGALELTGVTALKRRATAESLRIPVAGVITRAVESISATIGRTRNCLAEGGLAIFMKGPSVDPEIEDAKRAHGAEYELTFDHAYTLPGTAHRRRLVAFRRLRVGERAGDDVA
jgi:16S rRNA (guanine527-N7)-methyltransferase